MPSFNLWRLEDVKREGLMFTFGYATYTVYDYTVEAFTRLFEGLNAGERDAAIPTEDEARPMPPAHPREGDGWNA